MHPIGRAIIPHHKTGMFPAMLDPLTRKTSVGSVGSVGNSLLKRICKKLEIEIYI